MQPTSYPPPPTPPQGTTAKNGHVLYPGYQPSAFDDAEIATAIWEAEQAVRGSGDYERSYHLSKQVINMLQGDRQYFRKDRDKESKRADKERKRGDRWQHRFIYVLIGVIAMMTVFAFVLADYPHLFPPPQQQQPPPPTPMPTRGVPHR